MSHLTETVGENVRRLRKERALSQEALGSKCGVDFKYLGELERGQANFTIGVLEKVAQTLDVHPADLLVSAADQAEREGADRRQGDLARLIDLLDATGVQFIREVVWSYVVAHASPDRAGRLVAAERPPGRGRRKT